MAKTRNTGDDSWFRVEELFERGDPAFVREIRLITDADRLGAFAARWYVDRRPEARRLLFDYLDQPLNAFRHEALVKRLFKLAWQADDDEVMGRFLVMFDRSIRRVVKSRRRQERVDVQSKEAALALAQQWHEQGADSVWFWHPGGVSTEGESLPRIDAVQGQWTQEALVAPTGTVMWRPRSGHTGPDPLGDYQREQFEKHRLFSLPTRRYLRRRAWRYFRALGKRSPERYVPALASALRCYRDEDVADGVALLDNWGLVHVLFHHSPVLRSPPRGWLPAAGRSLRELESAPMYEPLWLAAPRVLLELVREGRCRAVRQWALHLIRRDHGAVLRGLPVEELFAWLTHPDPLIVTAAVEVLRELPDLASLGVDRLLGLVDNPDPETIQSICDLLGRLRADQVSVEQAVRLAGRRPLPVARLGLSWLQAREDVGPEDCRALLGLVEAEAVPLRPEIVRWLRGVLSAAADFSVDWVLEFLDSRHADVRDEGWQWLLVDPRVAENVSVWQKLLESPHDDVRLRLVAVLEGVLADQSTVQFDSHRLDAELLRLLWATVLLNAHRGGRCKPGVVGQVVRRLIGRPDEAPQLLPLFAAALRSVRGPEWRAGLVGLVQVVQQRPALLPLIERTFPELKFSP